MFIITSVEEEEVEEEDGDAIEKVLWHQPKGMAEEALRNNKSIEPMLLNYLFDSEPDWNKMEFLIKWKGQSHLHCQWKSLSELQNVKFSNAVVIIDIIYLISCRYNFDGILYIKALHHVVNFRSLLSLLTEAYLSLKFQLSGFKKV